MVKVGAVRFWAALFLAKQDSLQCGGQSIIMLLKYVLGGEGALDKPELEVGTYASRYI